MGHNIHYTTHVPFVVVPHVVSHDDGTYCITIHFSSSTVIQGTYVLMENDISPDSVIAYIGDSAEANKRAIKDFRQEYAVTCKNS